MTGEISWHLGAVSPSRLATGAWGIEVSLPISDAEYASHGDSARLLTDTFSNSSFADLQRRYHDFKDAAEEVAKAFTEKRATPQIIQSINTQIEDLLTALRRFADRTAHTLSERYGKESREFAIFTDALSFEFDNSFPYRFAYHLRNFSDHKGAVPIRANQESKPGPGGSIKRTFQLVMNSQTLLDGHDWHSRVRSDLENIGGDFSIEAIADGVQLAARRAYCKMLLAQELAIVSAVEVIRDFARRAAPPTGYAPVFIQAPLDVGVAPSELVVSPISIEIANIAETALQEARAIAI